MAGGFGGVAKMFAGTSIVSVLLQPLSVPLKTGDNDGKPPLVGNVRIPVMTPISASTWMSAWMPVIGPNEE